MSTSILFREEKKKRKKKSAGIAETSNSNSLNQPGWEELGAWAHTTWWAGYLTEATAGREDDIH